MSTAVAFNLAELLLVRGEKVEDLCTGEVFRSTGLSFTASLDTLFRKLASQSSNSRPADDAVDGLKAFILAPAGEAQLAAYIGGAFVGFSRARAEVLGTVRAGDTLYSQLLVTQLSDIGLLRLVTIEALIHTQDGALTLLSEHTYLVTRESS